MSTFSLLYFRQDNCAPCEARKPVIEIIAEHADLPLVVVDVADPRNTPMVQLHAVRSTPTLVLANHDGRVAGWSGNFIRADTVLDVIARFRRDA